MKKIISGYLEFRKNMAATMQEHSHALTTGQAPHSLFIGCADSRVMPGVIASSLPGDLFIVRNVGNIVPPAADAVHSVGDCSEASALEYAVSVLAVRDVIVCGHSSCGAMAAVLEPSSTAQLPNLRHWLEFAASGHDIEDSRHLSAQDTLAQRNALLQLEHLRTYAFVREQIAKQLLSLHAWWFDIGTAMIHVFDAQQQRYVVLDEESAAALYDVH